MGVVNITWMGY